jgi:hypothetical protein
MATTLGSPEALTNETLAPRLRGSSACAPDRKEDPAEATIVVMRLTSVESPSPDAA